MNRVALSELDLLESLNQLCDGLFWWYLLILASVTVYSLINAFFLPEEEESITKQYNFKKRSELLKWKRQFQGKWNNISRDGFYELMIFNGAPKKIAEKYRNMPYGQKIDIDEKNENRIRIGTTGFPSHDGIWVIASHNPEDSMTTETTAPSKKAMLVKTWWDIDKEELVTSLYYPDTYLTAIQRRKITSEGNLKLEVELRKIARSCFFQAEFEKVGKK